MAGNLILQIFVSDMVGGAEVISERLMKRLRLHADILALCPPGEFADRLRLEGYRVRTLSGLARLHRERARRPLFMDAALFLVLLARATLQVVAAVVRLRPRAIQVNNANAGSRLLVCLLLARTILRPWCGRARWILVNHNLRPVFARDRAFDPLAALLFHRVILVTAASRGFYPRMLQGKVGVVHNGIDPSEFRFDGALRRAFREAQGLPDGAAAIGIIGRVSDTKGQALLLEALDRLMGGSLAPEFVLFIIGETLQEDRPYEEGLRRYLDGRDWGKQVRFLGKRGDVPALLPGLDIVVNASGARVGEALPLAVVEAMACARVVVAPRLGGLPEIITDGRDGYLYCPDDAADLANRLFRVLSDPDGRDKVGAAAAETARRKFGLDRMVADYLSEFGLAG